MLKKSLLIWLSIIPLAILNGGFRQYCLEKWFSETTAGVISVILLCLLIFIVSLIFIPRLGKAEPKTYWKMGLLWAFLTIVFETSLGLAIGMTIPEILTTYNIATGNFWLVVVLFIAISPRLTAKIIIKQYNPK